MAYGIYYHCFVKNLVNVKSLGLHLPTSLIRNLAMTTTEIVVKVIAGIAFFLFLLAL